MNIIKLILTPNKFHLYSSDPITCIYDECKEIQRLIQFNSKETIILIRKENNIDFSYDNLIFFLFNFELRSNHYVRI